MSLAILTQKLKILTPVADNGLSDALGACYPILEYIDWAHQDVTPTEVKLSIVRSKTPVRQDSPISLLNLAIGL